MFFDISSKEYNNNWYTELKLSQIVERDENEERATLQNKKDVTENALTIGKLGLDPSKRKNVYSKEEFEDYINAIPITEEQRQDVQVNIEDVKNSDVNEKLSYVGFIEKILKAGDQLYQVMNSEKDIQKKRMRKSVIKFFLENYT